ncbi:MAG TPA: Dabb family protein [Chitinophagaceae bacterium]|nr:Dabb family protein [Chitinophagaceae bacterium]
MQLQNIFVHHVYFFLKERGNKEHQAQLIDGLRKLSAAPTIKDFHIGVPADTNRDVIERGYAASWFVLFANGEDQASYQVDPIHLKFVEECAHLWEKVIVYDSIDA